MHSCAFFHRYCPHGGRTFATWHRPYLWQFELALISAANTVANSIVNVTGVYAAKWQISVALSGTNGAVQPTCSACTAAAERHSIPHQPLQMKDIAYMHHQLTAVQLVIICGAGLLCHTCGGGVSAELRSHK